MTPEQRLLARHALGLPNDRNRSYRNRFFTAIYGDTRNRWVEMVEAGWAEVQPVGIVPDERHRFLFSLTTAGALLALDAGESLCQEDFPPTDSARRAHEDEA